MSGKAIFFGLLLLVFVGLGGFWVGQNYKLVPQQNPVLVATPTAEVTQELSPTAETTPSTTPDETATIVAAVKAGLIAEHGQDAASMNVAVTQVEGEYAKGTAGGTGGGGIWFAAKTGDSWKLVWDGNGMIECTSLTNYPNFPKDMIPECFDSSTQKMVTR